MKKILFFLTLIILCISACTKEDDDSENISIPDISTIYKGIPEGGDTLTNLADYLESSSEITFSLLSQTPTDVIQLNSQGYIIATSDIATNLGADTIIQATVTVISPSETYDISVEILLTNEELFISHWQLDGSYEVQLPLYEGTENDPTEYDFMVDWGDGTVDHIISATDENTKHSYTTAGLKRISIIGKLKGFNFNANAVSKNLITDISAWGNVLIGNKGSYFYGCTKLHTFSATDAPDLSQTTNLSYTFHDAISFKEGVSNWDVSNITDMTGMFSSDTAFNGDISSWDVTNVSNMKNMFLETNAFNANISAWDVSNVTDMEGMFFGAEMFNSDISAWDVSKVTNMRGMFFNTAFNGDIGAWDVSNVTDMRSMFSNADAFNRDISNWDVTSVIDMGQMFYDADAFNSNISSWNVNNVTNMSAMFSGATAFNGDINDWDVSNVINMIQMFSGATAFNSDISTWNVSKVTHMNSMFANAVVFNQDLSSWNTINVTSCDDFAASSALLPAYYPTLGECF